MNIRKKKGVQYHQSYNSGKRLGRSNIGKVYHARIKKPFLEIVGILHNIRSAHNVGSIFRTADARGITRLYLTGYTPTPLDRYSREVKEIHKTALGAEKHVPWTHVRQLKTVIAGLQREGFYVVAFEKTPQSRNYRHILPSKKVACVFGNEVEGLSHNALSLADRVLHIPMEGIKESLNVSVAFGVGVYGIRAVDQSEAGARVNSKASTRSPRSSKR